MKKLFFRLEKTIKDTDINIKAALARFSEKINIVIVLLIIGFLLTVYTVVNNVPEVKIVNQDPTKQILKIPDEDEFYVNQESRKFHKPECIYAKKCTVNCIWMKGKDIKKANEKIRKENIKPKEGEEAEKEFLPCKVCHPEVR